MERNNNRERSVPESVIQKMYFKFDVPMMAEGWDEIRIVGDEDRHDQIDTLMLRLSKLEHDNPHHEYTVGQHSMTAWQYLISHYKGADAALLRATLLHDIGKEKKRPMKKYSKETGRVPIIATMANESRSRRATWLRMGCNAFSGKKPSSQPMSFWTEEDVLEYLYTYQVPYASVYGEIVRTDGGGGRRQAKSVLAVSFAPLALTLKKLQTVSSV